MTTKKEIVCPPYEKADSDAEPGQFLQYKLNKQTLGFAELRDNCWNYTVISRDPACDIREQEYLAGFVQGKLQGELQLKAARNNTWNNFHLCDVSEPDKKFPKQFDPSQEELERAAACIKDNFYYTWDWIKARETDRKAVQLLRVFYRLKGIYDATRLVRPQMPEAADFAPGKVPAELHYGHDTLTFYDLYLINTSFDVFDIMGNSNDYKEGRGEHCSAFVKRLDDGNIIFTHNTWLGFLSQSLTLNVVVGNDFISENCGCQGQIASLVDYGFNGHGICFYETTHRYSHCEPKTKGLWMSWRATIAELFAESVNDFYNSITLDNTGTFLNGYVAVDAHTGEMALIEMSYKRFVYFYSEKKGKLEITDTLDGTLGAKDYDRDLITDTHIFGVNYPVAYSVARDLQSTDNRPLRKVQFNARIDLVKDMESARDLITYTAPDEPLSIFGRWDLGFGTTSYPKTIADGAIDAKVFSTDKVKKLLSSLSFIPNAKGGKNSFWMLFGTPKISGKPFIWSESPWAKEKAGEPIDVVPDRLEGAWNKTRLYMD